MNTLLILSLLLLAAPPTAESEPEQPADAEAEQPEDSSSDAPSQTEPAPAPVEADEPATDETPATEAPAPEAAEEPEEAESEEPEEPESAEGVTTAPVQPFVQSPPPVKKPPRPDRPLRWRLDFSLGVASTLVGDTGYRAFSNERSLLGPDLGVRFDYRLGRRLFLGGGARYQRFATERNPYDGLLSTELVVHEPTLYARASLMTVEGVDVFADLGGGPSIVLDQISSGQSDAKRRRTPAGAFSAMGGVALYLPKQWLPGKQASRVTAGIETRFGYQFRTTVDMSTNLSLDDEPLRTTTAEYGDLGLRGFAWGVSLFIRVM
ncbi:MAG: hypothetical protein ACE37F_14935 [Nannocystaceae bacterium]|nr:hypothetical protein [bacterium]